MATERQHQRTPGRDGLWSGTWSSTQAQASARRWADGWDLAERCPPDPYRRASSTGPRVAPTAPEGGACRGKRWRDTWEDSQRVVRTLRRAGYVARHRWPRVEAELRTLGQHQAQLHRYQANQLDGHLAHHPDQAVADLVAHRVPETPVAGLVAADPWEAARALGLCARGWYRQLRGDAVALQVMQAPRRCGRRHLCPVCAAQTSSSLARALRDLVTATHEAGDLGPLALVTHTHRVSLAETLAQALARWRGAWDRMTKGRPGRAWQRLVASWYLGLEVTRTWPGKGQGTKEPPESAQGWHVHGHLVVELDPAALAQLKSDGWPDPVAGARHAVAELWREATGRQALAAGLPGYGWQPEAGGCRLLDQVGGEPGAFDASGGWWRPIDPAAPVEVYQACKYPTPLAKLGPVALAEFLAVAYGRRWHQGGGGWRSARRLAAALELEPDDAPVLDAETGDLYQAPKVRPLLCRVGPQHAPAAKVPADQVEEEKQRWRLRWDDPDETPSWLAKMVEELGGELYTTWRTSDGETKTECWLWLPLDQVDVMETSLERALAQHLARRERLAAGQTRTPAQVETYETERRLVQKLRTANGWTEAPGQSVQ